MNGFSLAEFLFESRSIFLCIQWLPWRCDSLSIRVHLSLNIQTLNRTFRFQKIVLNVKNPIWKTNTEKIKVKFLPFTYRIKISSHVFITLFFYWTITSLGDREDTRFVRDDWTNSDELMHERNPNEWFRMAAKLEAKVMKLSLKSIRLKFSMPWIFFQWTELSNGLSWVLRLLIHLEESKRK